MATLGQSRFFLGFHTGDIPTGSNTYLNNLVGFGITYQYDTAETEDTTWIINRNDGDTTEDKITVTAQTLANTAPFTFELVGDATNNRWGWNLNGGAFTYYTTEIPTTNQNLRFTFRIEEISSDVTTFDMYYLYLIQDR